MKISILIGVLLLTSSFLVSSAYAETLEFGMRLVPTKIIESTESKIEIFTVKNGKLFPQPIKDFTITSQDPDLLEIIQKDFPNGFNVSILVDAKKPGDAKISVAADGYKPTEFTITIHQNNRNEKNIILKAIPDIFTINGPKTGFLSVELLDEDGNPIVAKEDIDVRFSTSNDYSISLDQYKFTIKKGSYYKVQQFKIKSLDNPIVIFAKTEEMPVAEKNIDVIEPDKPFTINLYITPDKSSRNSIGNSFAIVQLQDEEGSPILATRDIPVSIKVESPYANGLTLTERGFTPQVTFDGELIIREGTYWDSVRINTNAGLEGEYQLGISAKGFDVGEPKILELLNVNEIDDPNVVFDPLPVLMTGGVQLVGVVYLEDDDGTTLLASKNMDFRIFGSEDVFSPIPSHIEKLNSASEVFADLGYSKPEFLTVHENFENNELTEPEVFGPDENSLELRSEPLIDKIRTNTVFPVVSYVVDNDAATWYFPNDDEIFISPSDIVSTTTKIIHAGSSPVLMEMFASEEGSETLLVQTGKLTAQMKVNTHNILSSKLHLDVPQRIFKDVTSEIIFQILDSQDNPIFANTDIIIDAISNDKSILDIDKQLKIKRGESFTIVDIVPKNTGTVELSLLATGFPLTTETITIDKLEPVIVFQGIDEVEANTSFNTSIIVTFDDMPLRNIPVSWNVINAVIQGEDKITNEEGIANISLISDHENIKINAKVTSDFLPSTSELKLIKVNSTNSMLDLNEPFNLFGNGILLLLVPIVFVGLGIFLKKKNLLKINKKNN